LITPPNFGAGGGSCLPLMVVVALGEPSLPVTSTARAGAAASGSSIHAAANPTPAFLELCPPFLFAMSHLRYFFHDWWLRQTGAALQYRSEGEKTASQTKAESTSLST
jgi:hypothetical protein